MEKMIRLLDRGDSLPSVYPDFRHYMEHSPETLSALSPQHFDKIINAVISGLQGLSQLFSAEERARRSHSILMFMIDRLQMKPEPDTFNRVIYANSRIGDISTIQSLQQLMKSKFGYLSDSQNVLESLLKAYANQGDIPKILEIFATLRHQDPTIRPFNALMNAHVVRGDESAAIQLLEQIKREGLEPDAFTYEALIRLSLDKRNHDQLLKWIQEFKSSGGKDQQPTRKMYDALIRSANQHGDHALAVETLKTMTEQGIRFSPVTYKEQVVALAGTGQRELAWKAYARDVRLSAPQKYVVNALVRMQGTITFASLAELQKDIAAAQLTPLTTMLYMQRAYAEKGDVASTVALYKECQKIDKKSVAKAREACVTACIAADDIDAAVSFIRSDYKGESEPIPSRTYFIMLQKAALKSDDVLIEKVANRIRKEYPTKNVDEMVMKAKDYAQNKLGLKPDGSAGASQPVTQAAE
eukprot:jgi/Hompol1/6204/HPOL_004874-RA